MIRNAAKSLPRRERSIPARAAVTNRASVMQNSTSSRTASSATNRPSPPRASPTVTPSRPITLASGQAPVAEAASSPTASGRVRTGYRASVAGSRVPSRPKDEERQDQPAEREQGEDDRGQIHRRAVAAQRGQAGEGAGRNQHGERRADNEGDLSLRGRAQRVAQQAQLQLDEEPSHDSPSPPSALEPTRSMNAFCSVLPPRTCSVVPVATIRPLSMMDTWSQTCSTSSMT